MTQDRSLTTAPPTGMQMPAGMHAVALLSEDEFERNLSMMKTSQERTRRIQQTLMTEGRDYGTIPGTQKPTLLKPGAEILALSYGFVLRVETSEMPGDGVHAPQVRYDAICYVHAGAWDGPIVAVGYGTCNGWEKKYRYRTTYGATLCPGCGKAGLVHTKARNDRPEQWWHPVDPRGMEPGSGCGENFPYDTKVERVIGETIENPDPYDLANTILKIAEKRAAVDGILRATGTSGLFTVEEDEDDKKAEKPEARSRREFNDWVAETGLDPAEVMDLGKTIYPGRDLRRIAIWERTAWRAIAERDILFATPEQRAERKQQQAAQPPAAAAGTPEGAEPTTTPPAEPAANGTAQQPPQQAEATRAAAATAGPGPGGIGRSADEVAAGVREREAVGAAAGSGRMWTATELADIE